MRKLAAATVAVLALAAPAAATRAPTAAERQAIELAVRFFPTVGRQNHVRFAQVRVSTADPRYAFALARVSDPDGAALGSLAAVIHRSGGWQVVVIGPPPLRCAKVPAGVRADLGGAACAR